MSSQTLLTKPVQWVLIISAFVLPLFFLPVTVNYYDTNKWMLLVVVALATVIFWSLRTVVSKTISLSFPPIILGFGALCLASLTSLILSSANKIEALTHPLGLMTYAASVVILLFGGSYFGGDKKERMFLRKSMEYGAGILAILTIYQHIGLAGLFAGKSSTLTDSLWTPAGSAIGLLTYLLLMLPWIIQTTKNEWKKRAELQTAVSFLTTLFVLIAIGMTTVSFIPKISTTIMPFSLGWTITGHTLTDNLTTSLAGIGVEHFLTAFTKFRPASLNSTPIWNIAFGVSNSIVTHISTIFGVLGFLSLLSFVLMFWQTQKHSRSGRIMTAMLIAIMFFFPPTFLFFPTILFIMLASWNHTSDQPTTAFGSLFFTVIPTILVLVCILGILRWYTGELIFFQAQKAKAQGNGTKTYQLERKALDYNPMATNFHIALAQTTLSLADAIIATADTDHQSMLSGDDKQTIASLLDATIRHSKLAAVLSPNDVYVWTAMGSVYTQLVGVAQSADIWAIAAYQKAITLNPTNPVLYLDLGNVYTKLKKWNEAEQAFAEALLLKPDYANASYNLGHMYGLKGDKEKALSTLNQTITMIPDSSSEEMIKVLEEMKTLR